MQLDVSELPSALPSVSHLFQTEDGDATDTATAASTELEPTQLESEGRTGCVSVCRRDFTTRNPYCIKSLEEDMSRLRKDNLNLRLRIYLYEEQGYKRSDAAGHSPWSGGEFLEYKAHMDELISKLNSDLHAENEALRQQIDTLQRSAREQCAPPTQTEAVSCEQDELREAPRRIEAEQFDLSSFNPSVLYNHKNHVDPAGSKADDASTAAATEDGGVFGDQSSILGPNPLHSTLSCAPPQHQPSAVQPFNTVHSPSASLECPSEDAEDEDVAERLKTELARERTERQNVTSELARKASLLRQLGSKFDAMESAMESLIQDNTAKTEEVQLLTSKLETHIGQLNSLTMEYERLKAQTRKHFSDSTFHQSSVCGVVADDSDQINVDHDEDISRIRTVDDAGAVTAFPTTAATPSAHSTNQAVVLSDTTALSDSVGCLLTALWSEAATCVSDAMMRTFKVPFNVLWSSHAHLIRRLEETSVFLQQIVANEPAASCRTSLISGYDAQSPAVDRVWTSLNRTLDASRRISHSFAGPIQQLLQTSVVDGSDRNDEASVVGMSRASGDANALSVSPQHAADPLVWMEVMQSYRALNDKLAATSGNVGFDWGDVEELNAMLAAFSLGDGESGQQKQRQQCQEDDQPASVSELCKRMRPLHVDDASRQMLDLIHNQMLNVQRRLASLLADLRRQCITCKAELAALRAVAVHCQTEVVNAVDALASASHSLPPPSPPVAAAAAALIDVNSPPPATSRVTLQPTRVETSDRQVSLDIDERDTEATVVELEPLPQVIATVTAATRNTNRCCDCRSRVQRLEALLAETKALLASAQTRNRARAAHLDGLRRGAAKQLAETRRCLPLRERCAGNENNIKSNDGDSAHSSSSGAV